MRKALFLVAACVLGLALAGTAEARPEAHGVREHRARVVRNEHGHARVFKTWHYDAGHYRYWPNVPAHRVHRVRR